MYMYVHVIVVSSAVRGRFLELGEGECRIFLPWDGDARVKRPRENE